MKEARDKGRREITKRETKGKYETAKKKGSKRKEKGRRVRVEENPEEEVRGPRGRSDLANWAKKKFTIQSPCTRKTYTSQPYQAPY